jgi:protein arginine kinase activator
VSERRCDQCHEREGVIHLHRVEGSAIVHLYLCERCAAEKGLETSASLGATPVGTFLASMGKDLVGKELAAAAVPGLAPSGSCPGCGASLADFRETGRLGCAECYRVFEAPLRDLLRRLHGSSRHLGERYHGPGAGAEAPRQDFRQLREELRRAIETENFELAAELRDRLRAIGGVEG